MELLDNKIINLSGEREIISGINNFSVNIRYPTDFDDPPFNEIQNYLSFAEDIFTKTESIVMNKIEFE